MYCVFTDPSDDMNPPLILTGCLLAASTHAAFQPVPRLDSSSVTFLQRGSTNPVSLAGEGLTSASLPLPGHPTLRVALVPDHVPSVLLEGSAGGISVRTADPARSLTLQIVVAPDAPLGPQELRVASPGGVSNPITFQITDLPEIIEPKGTAQPGSAPLLQLPVGVDGRISAGSELDHYRFKARAGEELILDLQANRTGSPLDATLVLLDSQGREIVRSEDGHGLDPFLVFKAPADGEYVARLNDTRYLGGDRFRYHLVIGSRPYLESVFPFGGRRGSTVDVQLLGHLLHDTARMTLTLDPAAPAGRQEIRARTPDGHSNPVGFEVGTVPELMEAEPNDEFAKANPATGAVVINGRIGKPGDQDHFRFRSATDQRWIIEVSARRFGSPLDALLTLHDAAGKVLQRNDDADGPDARIEFDAAKDTDYVVNLRDLTDRGGDRFGYRLHFRLPDVSPDFSVRSPAGRVRLHRGGWVAVKCDVARRNGFDGMVRVEGASLPPGVFAIPFTLADNAGSWVLLGANADTAGLHFPLRLQGTASVGGRPRQHDAQLAEAGWLTLLPPAPFSIDVAQASASITQNAAGKLDIAVIRQPGFDAELKVTAEGPAGVNIPPLVLPPGQSTGSLQLNAAYNAATGTRPVLVRCEAVIDGQSVVQAAPRLVDLTVEGIPLFATAMLPGSPFFRTDAVKLSAVALPTNSPSAANRSEFVVKVERRGYDGEVALALEGVPEGVIATFQPLPAKARETSIQLLATENAPTGKDHAITVTTTFTQGDRIWRQKTAPVTLTLAAPAIEIASTNTPANTPAIPTPTP